MSICPYCDKNFPKSKEINSRHKAKCPGWRAKLGDRKPRACICGHESSSLTQMKRHREECLIWNQRNRGEIQMARLADTLQSTYGEGVTLPRMVPGAEDARKKTCLIRYGSESIFSRESYIFDKVQASLVGKRTLLRGKDNPFAWPCVKDKIRETSLKRYGVENCSQSPLVRAKTRQTNLKRYGYEEILSSPEVRARIRVTNMGRYGGPAPSCSPKTLEKTRQANLEHWGVEWTAQDPGVRQKQLETMESNYGGHFFASDEGRQRIKDTLLDRYGVDHPAKIPGFWNKVVATFVRRYGVTHPLKDPEILARVFSSGRIGPNLLEQRFAEYNPELKYTGNGIFWRRLPLLGRPKNPDFILPGPDLSSPTDGVSKVVELFGDYWHGPKFTGVSCSEHVSQLTHAFREIGIDCLVIWESEFKANPEECRQRVLKFIDSHSV